MDFEKLTPKDVYDFFVLNGRTLQSTTTINPLTGRRYPDIYVQAAAPLESVEYRFSRIEGSDNRLSGHSILIKVNSNQRFELNRLQ